MIANNASGIKTVKYGATKDHIQRLTVVLPKGDIIEIGNRARKSSSGYNLIHLFVGSEGTLGLITEATLRLDALPANFMALRVTFPEIKNATDTVFQIMSSGFTPAAMEFLDTNVIGVLNRDRNLEMEEQPTLLMEFNGFSNEGLRAEMTFIEDICKENSSTFIDKGIGQEEKDRLWEMRYQTFESIKRQHVGMLPLIVDVAVPLSRYSEMVAVIKKEVNTLQAYVFGHAGDGNIHVIIMDTPTDSSRWARVECANTKIVKQALAFEGTCTGEHGVGIGKRGFLPGEHGNSLELMKRIKSLIDPQNLFNPGKLFP